MKAHNALFALPLTAAGPVRGNRCVGFDGAEIAAQGGKVAGVAQYPADKAGDPLAVTAIGEAVVETGAAVVRGDSLIADAQGRAIPAAGTAGEHVFADAEEAAAASGSTILALLRR